MKGDFVVTGEELRSTALVKGLFAGATGKNVSGAGADLVESLLAIGVGSSNCHGGQSEDEGDISETHDDGIDEVCFD